METPLDGVGSGAGGGYPPPPRRSSGSAVDGPLSPVAIDAAVWDRPATVGEVVQAISGLTLCMAAIGNAVFPLRDRRLKEALDDLEKAQAEMAALRTLKCASSCALVIPNA